MADAPTDGLQTSGTTTTVQIAGRTPGSAIPGVTATDTKIYAPIASGTTAYTDPFGSDRGDHRHGGIDVGAPVGTKCVAPADGKIGRFSQTTGFGTGGGMIHFVFTQDTGEVKAGTVIGWGHVFKVFARPGESVKAGQVIASSGTAGTGPHVHFIQRGDSNGMDGSVDPAPLFRALQKGSTSPTSGGSGGGGSGGTGDNTEAIAKAAAFSTFLQLPGVLNSFESRALAGQKSLMNDQPLLPFVLQLCQASLRSFQSMPNGNFFAFFPDYFGGLDHRTPYWQIEDIEIIDGKIDLSDDALATHVYVVGDIVGFDGVIGHGGDGRPADTLFSSGVVTLFNAFSADFLNGVPKEAEKKEKTESKAKTQPDKLEVDPEKPSLGNHEAALAFLQKYGARPHFEEAPMVRSPFFELFLAYQKFCLLWSRQFLTTFEFTFMPELFPGGIVAFPSHGIQCYIDEVVHEFDYENGFTTQANLSAPAALDANTRQGIKAGMIRAFSFSPDDQPFDPFLDQGKKK